MSDNLAPASSTKEIEDLLARCGLPITDRFVLPGRPVSLRPAPDDLRAEVRELLQKQYPAGVYSHQAAAIDIAISGGDVCIATPTASGKSLAFMSAAGHHVLTDPSARVLALYPMKALIRDQVAKWEEFLGPLGLTVGYVDGSVPMTQREAILRNNRVVAMTPDVVHAWVMSHLADKSVGPFVRSLRLLVLDEAHVYEGVFGTNMAYLLRRLAVAAGRYGIVASTATVGDPEHFMRTLTGRSMRVLGADADGSAGYEKTVLSVKPGEKASFDSVVEFVRALARSTEARFIAFADSRKAVELLTAAVHRNGDAGAEAGTDADAAPDDDAGLERIPAEKVLPYRAGYEEADRSRIQKALAGGSLAGVISTSALELGLDIGDLDVVVLTNSPPTTKAFYQRIGRAGRRRPSVCVIVDDLSVAEPLDAYVRKQPEPGWVYLENRYLQYTQALCASSELQSIGKPDAAAAPFADLPQRFVDFLDNELNPTKPVADDLFHLRAQGQSTPHYEFPIRNAAEPNFTVSVSPVFPLGTLSYSQLVREAYPGAAYYYLARPYRVVRINARSREVRARPDRFVTTQPTAQAAVFVDFGSPVLQALRSPNGFVVEADLQVWERVTGFTEKRGRTKKVHEYGPTSPYSQRPLSRIFRTTGVCLAFPGRVARSEALAGRLMEAFCRSCGVLGRDLGVALFKSPRGPFDTVPVDGLVVYDATVGSLRLTERLVERLAEVVQVALEMDGNAELSLAGELRTLTDELGALRQVDAMQAPTMPQSSEDDVVEVIAPNERAMLLDGNQGPEEVMVLGHRYTPQGLMYELKSSQPNKWMVATRRIQPLVGVTRTLRVNLLTGDEVV